MSKVLDITDRLDFEENPKLKIRGVELEVNADAETMLRVMGLVSDNPTAKDILELNDLIFTEEAKSELKKLKLKFKDFQKVVMAAIDVANGDDEDPGEQETPTTT